MTDHVLDQISLYLDKELQGEEQHRFEAHVAVCAECHVALERERELDRAVRQVRPLYVAPETLRLQVRRRLEQAAATDGEAWTVLRSIRLGPRLWMALAASVIITLSAGLTWYITTWESNALTGPSEFALMAVNTHQRFVRGQLPLEVLSRSAAEVSGWFDGKVPFNLKLPNYPELPDRPKPYELAGARLISFRKDPAAYVSYRLRQRPISLLVTSETSAQPSGGEEIEWRGLRFHFDAVDGWKVLTWSDNGLTYALVSDFEERGQASCIVCHPGPQDQRMFEGLRQK